MLGIAFGMLALLFAVAGFEVAADRYGVDSRPLGDWRSLNQ